MRIFTFFTFFFSFHLILSAQGTFKATDIVAEREQDNISITYRLPGSKTDESFFITISASIDGGPKTTLRLVTGDVGANVRGGKMQYKIVWEALKEVTQIGTAEFYISAEKTPAPVRQNPEPKEIAYQGKQRKWLIAADVLYDGNEEVPILGLRLAYYKKWGGYLALNPYRVMAGPVYSFNNPARVDWSGYLGTGVIFYDDYNYNSTFNISYTDKEVSFGAEIGTTVSFNWFSVSAGLALDLFGEVGYITSAIGIRF